MPACWYAQTKLNNNHPVAYSIPATEHSIMTAHVNEKQAMIKLLNEFGSGVCACVMDSYDYTNALEKVLPSIAKLKVEKGGFLVLRPDSGDPVQVILEGLEACNKVFGSDLNAKGYKVLRGVGLIQGDGINITVLKQIARAVNDAGYSAQNVAYGMGGGLLQVCFVFTQKVNRDTMQFATKLSLIVDMDGKIRNVMKNPKTAKWKRSLPGELSVVMRGGLPYVIPFENLGNEVDMLQVVYDSGRQSNSWRDFQQVRDAVTQHWNSAPKLHDPISEDLRNKMEQVVAAQDTENAHVYDEEINS